MATHPSLVANSIVANFRFKLDIPDLEDRKRQAMNAITQYPDKVPVGVIVVKS